GAGASSWAGLVGQDIADPAYGLQDARMPRIVPELLAQPRDVDVDRPVERLLGIPPGELDDLLARQDATGARGQGVEKRELVACEGELVTLERGAARPRIEREVADADDVGRRPGSTGGAAYDGADSGQELARGEWLGYIVVRPELEPHHAIRLLAARGDHDDRHARRRPQLATHVETVPVGQRQVEQDDVEATVQRLAQTAPAGRHAGDDDSVTLEIGARQLCNAWVIFD